MRIELWENFSIVQMNYAADSRLREFQESLLIESRRSKVKFCVKIWRILRWTLDNPDMGPRVGIFWAKDGVSFVSNPKILGAFLNLKSNSINTNLRCHGFEIKSTSADIVAREYPYLPDRLNWRVRYSKTTPWNTSTTEDEAREVPLIEGPMQNRLEIIAKKELSIIPDQLTDLIGDNKDIERDILNLLERVSESSTWKSGLLTRATSEWCSMTSSLRPISHGALVKNAIDRASPAPPRSYQAVIEANLGLLLMAQSSTSQAEGVGFVDFLKLILRFGFLDKVAYSVYEISTPHEMFCYDFNEQSQHDVEARFASWFVPSTDQNMSKAKLQTIPWVVRMASSPNMFTIQLQNGKTIIATHIKYNAMALRVCDAYSVEFDGGDEEKRAHLKDLLVEVLGLEVPEFGSNFIKHKRPQFVQGNIVADNAVC